MSAVLSSPARTIASPALALATLLLATLLFAPLASAQFDPAKASVESAAVSALFPDPRSTTRRRAFAAAAPISRRTTSWSPTSRRCRRTPAVSRCASIGRSQRGRPIPLLVFARGASAAGDARGATGAREQRPTVLIVAQQHGNEPAGSEAALVIAGRLANGDLRPLLDRINVLIVPHANPDGAEAFVRDTASHVDMNRDHLLLRTPEARASPASRANTSRRSWSTRTSSR